MTKFVFNILVCWKWLGNTKRQASIVTLMQLSSRVVLRMKNVICILQI